MSQGRPVTAFPTEPETLALQASLLDGEAALAAWKKLSFAGTPEEAGIGWIAPLLMANLKRLQPTDPWVVNNPHFLTLCELKRRVVTQSAQTILEILRAAGVPTLALKGLALGESVYPSPGLRTVSDLDILVPVKDVFRAIAALQAGGLRAARGAPETPADLRKNHAHVFSAARRHEPTLDLHWHVLASARRDNDDEPFWSQARSLRIGATQTTTLCPEDQLLHALVHGVRWTRMPHVRWVADVALILRGNQDTFRMDRFLEVAQRFDAVTPVQEGLSFVVKHIDLGNELLESVAQLRRSAFSRHAFKARATSYEDRSVTDRIALRVETALWARRARRP